jgi:adenylyl-sulfate kinase
LEHFVVQTIDSTSAIESCVIWFTGLSGAGKSTLASMLAARLLQARQPCALLDGDAVRQTLCRDLGFSDADRKENMRRLAGLAGEVVAQGKIALVAAISPLKDARNEARAALAPAHFIEVFVDSPLAVCESRDPKGLYRKARQGEIQQFTGIDSVYEPPTQPEIHVRTDRLTPEQCVERVIEFLNGDAR